MKAHANGEAIGFMLAWPVLIAVALVLAAAGATNSLVVVTALLAWFGGPVLLIIGVALMWRRTRWTVAPSTAAGRWSLRLSAGFVATFALFLIALGLELGPDRSETFFSNLFLAVPGMLAAALAIAAGAAAGIALFGRRERSLMVVGTLVFGALVAVFVTSEVIGHDEPRGGGGRDRTDFANSHTNISVTAIGSDSVRVSFDYAYGNDPEGGKITAITVTPLAADREPIPGYEPAVRPVDRGSGRMDVTFSFAGAEMEQLGGFKICFTGEGQPDLGCAVRDYDSDQGTGE